MRVCVCMCDEWERVCSFLHLLLLLAHFDSAIFAQSLVCPFVYVRSSSWYSHVLRRTHTHRTHTPRALTMVSMITGNEIGLCDCVQQSNYSFYGRFSLFHAKMLHWFRKYRQNSRSVLLMACNTHLQQWRTKQDDHRKITKEERRSKRPNNAKMFTR